MVWYKMFWASSLRFCFESLEGQGDFQTGLPMQISGLINWPVQAISCKL